MQLGENFYPAKHYIVEEVVTNVQLYLALGVSLLVNAMMMVLFVAYVNAKFEAVEKWV